MRLSPARQRLLNERNREIYRLATDPDNPRTGEEIVEILSKRKNKIYHIKSRQQIYHIVRKIQNEQSSILTN